MKDESLVSNNTEICVMTRDEGVGREEIGNRMYQVVR
jgi:hypothetical protein